MIAAPCWWQYSVNQPGPHPASETGSPSSDGKSETKAGRLHTIRRSRRTTSQHGSLWIVVGEDMSTVPYRNMDYYRSTLVYLDILRIKRILQPSSIKPIPGKVSIHDMYLECTSKFGLRLLSPCHMPIYF